MREVVERTEQPIRAEKMDRHAAEKLFVNHRHGRDGDAAFLGVRQRVEDLLVEVVADGHDDVGHFIGLDDIKVIFGSAEDFVAFDDGVLLGGVVVNEADHLVRDARGGVDDLGDAGARLARAHDDRGEHGGFDVEEVHEQTAPDQREQRGGDEEDDHAAAGHGLRRREEEDRQVDRDAGQG